MDDRSSMMAGLGGEGGTDPAAAVDDVLGGLADLLAGKDG